MAADVLMNDGVKEKYFSMHGYTRPHGRITVAAASLLPSVEPKAGFQAMGVWGNGLGVACGRLNRIRPKILQGLW